MFDNKSNAIKINHNDLSIEHVDINELVIYYKSELSKKNILQELDSYTFSIYINGTFESDTWAIYRDIKQCYRYLKFDELDKFKYKNITNEQRLLIKCWISQRLLDNYVAFDKNDNPSSDGRASEQTVNALKTINEFIIESNNFSDDFLSQSKGDNILYFFDERYSQCTSSVQKKYLSYLLDYLEFCLFKSNVDTSIYPEIVYQKYYSRVLRLFEDTQNDSKLTENSKAHLPSGTNILLFDFYINKFFNSDAISDTMKNYFYPLLIWWKLSNVIPIRASELCTKIPRDCLIVEDNNYYLIINRAKKSQKKGYLPILRKFKINKEFYDLVNDYINLTDKYGKTNTLFSYNAQLHLREELSKNNKLFYSVNSVANNNRKYNKEFYSYNPLRTLLNNFYIKIIGNYFKDTLITEKITLNDTRHFAFTSLSLQGIPMIEIAILGGHSTTRNIDDYTYDNNIYIDREVFKAINKSLAHYKTDKTSISNIVFDMPKVSPIPLEQCKETPFHNILLGYCTAQNEYACESYYCYNCSKWYCEPTIKNYQLLEKIIQKDLDDRLKEVNSNMDFMIKLFKNATILDTENSDKEVALEHNLSIKLRELSNKIQADTNDIIRLKSKLLQGIVDTELTELDIIERLQCLGSTFKDTTEYLE